MKSFLSVLFFVCFFGGFSPIILAQEVGEIIPITTINFIETEYDFGTIQSGEKVTQIYTFTNTGNEPLIISNARGSCGCTVPAWPKAPILPGETASIEVEFNSKNKRGQRNQKITIIANTNPEMTFLYLHGIVETADDTPAVTVETLDINLQPEVIDIESLNCVAVYPNPTSDILKLDLGNNEGKKAIVRIFSKTGQLMAERPIISIDGTLEFEVHHYPAGTYYASVQIENQKAVSHCFVVSGN